MKQISRRGFLKGAAGLGAGVAASGLLGGLAFASGEPDAVSGASVSRGGGSGEASGSIQLAKPDFLTAPEAIADSAIGQTLEADVVVVGCGLAGLMTARSAAEQGLRVIVVEKSNSYNYRSGQYGICGSSLQKARGMDFDGAAAVGDLMKEMGYRPDQRIWNYWRDYSGEAFDWLLEPAGDRVDVIDMYAKDYDSSRITVCTVHWPQPEAYDPAEEFSPTYPAATLTFIPDQGDILALSYQKCLDMGVDFHFATWARQLIRPENTGAVQGVIGEDLNGNYI